MSRDDTGGGERGRIGSSCTVCIADEFIFVDIPKAPVHGPMNFVSSQSRARQFPAANFAWELAQLAAGKVDGCPKIAHIPALPLHAV